MSEKILLKSFKELQKTSTKQPKKLLELALIFSAPIFKLQKTINKKSKKKNIKIIPTIVNIKRHRVFLAIKFLFNIIKKQSSKHFFLYLKEILINVLSNKKEEIFEQKIAMQKQALLKKHFLFYFKYK